MTERRGSDEPRKTPPWFRVDAGIAFDDKIMDLGADHGPAGPWAYIVLLGAAKTQDEDGKCKMGLRQLAIGAHLPGGPEEARAILATAADIGLLVVLEEDPRTVVVQIANWGAKQRPMPLSNAARQAQWRERQKAKTTPNLTNHPPGPVTPVTNETPDVTVFATGTETTTRTTTSSPPVVARDAGSSGMPERFQQVWEILQAARPALMLTDSSVMSALNAYPETAGHDHLRAAHCAAATANGPNRRVDVGHVLLMAELRKQAAGTGGGGRRPGPQQGGARATADDDIQRYLALADQLEKEGAA